MRIGIIVGLILTIFLLPRNSFAFENFSKLEAPLTIISNYQDWNEIGIFQSSVLLENSVHKLWYGSFNGTNIKLAYATSSDGLSWNGQTLLNLPSVFNNRNTHDPSILKLDSSYLLFFASSSNTWDDYKIYKISSIDGINFDQNSLSLVFGASQNWEQKAVSAPLAVFKNNVYYLFYSGWGDQSWQIGLAISNDGINWTKCLNNPIISLATPHSFWEKDNKYYLFFHHPLDPKGISLVESTDSLSCQMEWKNRQTILSPGPKSYDLNHMIAPSVIEKNNQLWLYYSGLGTDGIWRLSLATSQLPQPSPSPTPTPTPTPKTPIILLPGFMGSWNKEAILHNQPVSIFDWKLAPYVREYNGIINTLKNLGYGENQDFLIFPYDWRKSVAATADDLKNFIDSKFPDPNKKINIVGHSLGGLVARIYAQKHGTDRLNKLLTVGSPHQGTALAYKPVEGGELEKNNSFLWLAEKLTLILNKDSFETDKETIKQMFPVARDLFPSYNFLKNQNNDEITIQDMTIKNDTLLFYNPNLPNLPNLFQTIVGEKGNTLSGFKVAPRTIIDQLLNLYPDGRPIENYQQIGDYLIISDSAKAGNNPQTLNLDHGEIIFTKEAVNKILDNLAISYQDNQIAEGQKTVISPSLIFLLLSPAEMTVEFQGQIYQEQDGLIFIENSQSGDYTLKVVGKENGRYTVIIGQITDQKDFWSKVEGKITYTLPSPQTDLFTIHYDRQNPLESPINQNDILSLFDMLILEVSYLNEEIKNKNLTKALEYLNRAKNDYQNSKFNRVRGNLLQAHKYIFQARGKINNKTNRQLLEIIDKLESLYQQSLKNEKIDSSTEKLKKELKKNKKSFAYVQQKLLKEKNQGKKSRENVALLLLIKEKLEKAEKSLTQGNLYYLRILLKSVSYLINKSGIN